MHTVFQEFVMTQSLDPSSAPGQLVHQDTLNRIFRLPLTFEEMANVLKMSVSETIRLSYDFRHKGHTIPLADLSISTRLKCLETLRRDLVLSDELKDEIIPLLCLGICQEINSLQREFDLLRAAFNGMSSEKDRLVGEVASLRRHLPPAHASDADPIALTEAQIVAMKKPIKELNISGRSMNCLLSHGMTHIWRVCAMPNVMPAWENLGKKSWDNIRDALGWFNQQEGLGEFTLTLGMSFDRTPFTESLPQHGFPILDEQQIRNMKLLVSELPLSPSLRAVLVGSGFDQLWKVCRWKTCNISSHLKVAMIKQLLPSTDEDVWKGRESLATLLLGYSLGFDMVFDETLFTSPTSP